MIGKIIDALSAVSPEVGQRYGLCEKRGDTVFEYVGGGNGVAVNVDRNGTWSYFRITSPIRVSNGVTYAGCSNAYRHSVGIRFVLVTRRDGNVCDVSQRIISARNAFPGAKKAIATATGALLVLMPAASIEVDTARAIKAELNADPPLQIVFQYADLTVDLITESECLIPC